MATGIASVIMKDPEILGGEPVFRGTRVPFKVPAQMVDATPACSLLAGVSKPKVFLGR
jgi:hypothetical protein